MAIRTDPSASRAPLSRERVLRAAIDLADEAGIESSTGASPARWRYMNTILGCLREAGLSADLTDHAYHALDSHITGFTLWQVQIQIDPEKLPDMAATFLRELPGDEYPYLVEHVHQHLKEPSPEDEGSFAFGLDLILDGLERIRDAA